MTIDWMDGFNVTKCPVVYAQDLGSLCLKFVKINNLTSYIDPWFAQYIPSDYPVIFIIEFQVLFDFVSIVDISRQYFDWVLSWISDSGHSLASTEPQLTQGGWGEHNSETQGSTSLKIPAPGSGWCLQFLRPKLRTWCQLWCTGNELTRQPFRKDFYRNLLINLINRFSSRSLQASSEQ